MFVILLWCHGLLIRYTLDVMHCEQNLSKNILKTIIGLKDTEGRHSYVSIERRFGERRAERK